MNFAVIKTGGKQYKVAANDVLKIEKLEAQAGDVVTFDQVLMVGNGDDVTVGAPLVEGASVAAHFLGTKKQRTVLIIKKHRRQHFDRRNGHRQMLSTVRIGEILIGGAKPTLVADEKLRAKAAAEAAPVAVVTEAPAKPRKAAAPKAAPEAKAAKPKAEKPAAEAKAPKAEKAPKAAKPAAEKAPKAKAEKPAADKKPAAKKKAAPKSPSDSADQE
ncbi:MAG: 50S ribosomal protein L21 [Devosia nanyangense]|uniref:Large ribosomal subunit protein bL21 n=1 Tax=Devosia nanyangense TaxID=1228055 RepID=A0A933L4V1_9HYPH|nr:50S ribosomal protein L21 [Devosia nanyangense]